MPTARTGKRWTKSTINMRTVLSPSRPTEKRSPLIHGSGPSKAAARQRVKIFTILDAVREVQNLCSGLIAVFKNSLLQFFSDDNCLMNVVVPGAGRIS